MILALLFYTVEVRAVRFDDSSSIDQMLATTINKLQANTGSAFQYISTLVSTRDQIYLTVAVDLPHFEDILQLLSNDKFAILVDACKALQQASTDPEQQFTINASCTAYKNIQQVFNSTLSRSRLLMADQLLNLQEYIPGLKAELDSLMPKLRSYGTNDRPMYAPHRANRTYVPPLFPTPKANRSKRFVPIPLVIAGVKLAVSGITSALGMVRTHQMRKRIKSIQKDVNILAQHQFKLTGAVIHLNQSLTALAKATNNELIQIKHILHNVDAKLHSLTQAVQHNMLNIAQLADTNKLMTFATTTQVNQLLVLNALNQLTFFSERLLNRLTEAFHTLSLGHVPKEMISIVQLDELLSELAFKLKLSHPDYELSVPTATPYYKLDTVLWGIVANTVVINIPINIKEHNMKPFSLFKIQTWHVPVDVTAHNQATDIARPESYTKIMPEYKYIGITSNVYVLITETVLESCTKFQNQLHCSNLLVHTDNRAPSCLSLLYHEASLDLITKYCKIKYFYNYIPKPAIFENSEQLLLANVDLSWRIICKSDSFPKPVSGLTYAIIDKSSLCGCQIVIGENYFVPTERTGCGVSKFELKIRHPINALMVFNLANIIHNFTHNMDMYVTLDKPKQFDLPTLQVSKHLDENKVLLTAQSRGTPLQKVLDLITSNQEAYLTSDDLLMRQTHVDTWFAEDSLDRAIVFFMALSGLVSTIAIALFLVYYCKRQREVAVFLATILSKLGVSQASTLQNCPDLSVPLVRLVQTFIYSILFQISQAKSETENFFSHTNFNFLEIKIRTQILIGMCVSYLLFKLAKYLYIKYLKFRVILPNPSGQATKFATHIYLELLSDQEKCILYLMLANTSLVNLTMNPRTQAYIYKYDKYWFSGLLHFNWSKGHFRILNLKFEYPSAISVPFNKMWSVGRILKAQNHFSRIIIQQDVFYSIDGLEARRFHRQPPLIDPNPSKLPTDNLDQLPEIPSFMEPRKSKPYPVPRTDKKSKKSIKQSLVASCLPSASKGRKKSASDRRFAGLADEISKDSSRELRLMSDPGDDPEIYHIIHLNEGKAQIEQPPTNGNVVSVDIHDSSRQQANLYAAIGRPRSESLS